MLNKFNLEIATCCSKEETRYSIEHVLVTDKETAATDGHRLVIVSLPENSSELFPEVEGVKQSDEFERFMIPAASALEVARNIPQTKISVLNHAIFDASRKKTIRLAVAPSDNVKIYEVKRNEVWFPKYESIDITDKPEFEICLDPNLFIELMRLFGRFLSNEKYKQVKFQFFGLERQVKMIAKNTETGQTMTAFIMPMKDIEGVE